MKKANKTVDNRLNQKNKQIIANYQNLVATNLRHMTNVDFRMFAANKSMIDIYVLEDFEYKDSKKSNLIKRANNLKDFEVGEMIEIEAKNTAFKINEAYKKYVKNNNQEDYTFDLNISRIKQIVTRGFFKNGIKLDMSYKNGIFLISSKHFADFKLIFRLSNQDILTVTKGKDGFDKLVQKMINHIKKTYCFFETGNANIKYVYVTGDILSVEIVDDYLQIQITSKIEQDFFAIDVFG